MYWAFLYHSDVGWIKGWHMDDEAGSIVPLRRTHKLLIAVYWGQLGAHEVSQNRRIMICFCTGMLCYQCKIDDGMQIHLHTILPTWENMPAKLYDPVKALYSLRMSITLAMCSVTGKVVIGRCGCAGWSEPSTMTNWEANSNHHKFTSR